MMRTRTAAVPRRARRGVTLIEVIIAMIVMSIGIMGLAGTAGYVATQMGGGNAQTLAAAMATKIADSLASRRCASLVDGTQTNRRVTATWTITAPATPTLKVRTINQTLQYTVKSGVTKSVSYQTMIQCPE
jgi:prepilin-type N-terminal cleavage/methylation domain-containing protein